MFYFKIRIAIPSTKNRWEANVIEREIQAENLNQVIMKAATVEEYNAGARIISIQKQSNLREDYYGWVRIK